MIRLKTNLVAVIILQCYMWTLWCAGGMAMNVSAETELPNSNVNIANDSGKSVNINDVVFVDFESEPDASLVSSQSIAVDPDDAGNRVMKFENSTGKMNNVIKGIKPKKLLYKVPADKKGVLTYEFDLKFPTNNPMEDNEKGWYYPVATVFPTYDGTKTAYLRTCNVISASQNQNDVVLIDNYGEWYTVQEVFDYSSMTYSVFAQGKLVCSDISFAEESVMGNDPIDGLVFRAYVPDGFEWYLDNLKISYTEDREYAPVSAFFQENFDDGEYDNTILKLPISAEVVDASIDDVIPEERGRVIKIDSSAGGTDSYFDVQNWKLQMERKKGILAYEFDIYATDALNFKNASQELYLLKNAPEMLNVWEECSIIIDYKNKTIVSNIGGNIRVTDMAEEYNTNDLWKVYFGQWEGTYYLDNIRISYWEYDYEKILTATIDRAESSLAAEAKFTAYDESWVILAIYEEDETSVPTLLGISMSKAADLDGKISCEIDNFKVDYEKIYAAKAMIFSMPNIIPLCNVIREEYIPPVIKSNVITKYDDKTYSYPVYLSDEEPMLALQNLAEVIEGTAEENTLIKDGVKITYQADDRLAGYNNGHLMLERAPKVIDGQFYVPVSSVVPTLGYHMEYWRFDSPPVLEISTGTNYPEPEVTLYAKDFGAVGDGVNDDKEAVVKAINAAMMTGKPTRLEFEKDAVYRLSERMDRNAYITMSNVNNVELEGNGCTFLVEKPTTMFIELYSCTNVKIKNIKATWEEHTSTQGRITYVDKENMKFTVQLDEGFPDVAPEWWRKSIGYNSFYFGMLYHPTEDHIKITKFDTVSIEGITKIGDRLYEIPIPESRKNVVDCYEVNDRLVIPTRGSAYDTPESRMYNACVRIQSSKDIVMDGVTITGASQLGVSVGLCTGRIVFRNYSMETKPGALFTSNSDGIHYWRNRGGLIVENSKFMANLDDHINTKGEDSCLIEKRDGRTLVVEEEWIYKVGDEIVLYDTDSKHIVGRAFLKGYKREGDNAVLTLDRDLNLSLLRGINSDNASNPTRVYDLNVVGEGTIIRNSEFVSSRRHAYIGRSQNSIFEGNKVSNCGGSGLAAMNEVRSGTEACEGLFPSAFTFKDNSIEGDNGNNAGFYPMEVNSFKSDMNSQAAIDGFLIENNVISVPNSKYVMLIKAVKDLYMLNNKIIYNKELQSDTIPVMIANSEIALIDGLELESTDASGDHVFMNISGCEVNELNLNNIVVPSDGQWARYTIK